MRKEPNKELRSKILQLIYKELGNIGGQNIFHNTIDAVFEPDGSNDKPIYAINLLTEDNVDGRKRLEYEMLRYSLKFSDGEPSIDIDTNYSWIEKQEHYKTVRKWYGKKVYNTTITAYTFYTQIIYGHIRFELTNEEYTKLLEATKIAYEKHLSLKDEYVDKEAMSKLDFRLNNNLCSHVNKS